uniref:Uncharacterized protein n=1 Tax=Rhizophora mucronata TaxID=61149 RepID=A0A2P2QJV5_RHIMU
MFYCQICTLLLEDGKMLLQ